MILGALIGFVSWNFSFLLTGRILQALGTGIMLPMTQVIILTIYPVEKRGAVMGIYGLAAGSATVLAPTLAGVVIDIWNWRVIFLIALVIVIIDFILGILFMKDVLATEKVIFDFLSMLLCGIGFSGLLIGLGNLNDANKFLIIVPLLIGICALIMFSKRQYHLSMPLLNLRILGNKKFRFSVIVSMLLYATMMPSSLIMALISPFTGKFYDKFGIRKLAIGGSLVMVISCLAVCFVNETTSIFFIAGTYIFRLIAVGCIMMRL